ncbi:MAG: DUF4258 domain-containing protein [Deltaproteobacteria bacterium]|nr:DUF4258 domain-containing protein [Deltaproteobacteria bacterium]MBI5810347.1 DUF4258 domain-containing protein [Deltaproteobacteria bacterium]
MTGHLPHDSLIFIIRCVKERKILWTYHVNLRLASRYISRKEILDAVDSMKIIEEYPVDKYLPSCLIYAETKARVFHIHIAMDVAGDNVRIITAYEPDPVEWDENFKKRRKKQ